MGGEGFETSWCTVGTAVAGGCGGGCVIRPGPGGCTASVRLD